MGFQQKDASFTSMNDNIFSGKYTKLKYTRNWRRDHQKQEKRQYFGLKYRFGCILCLISTNEIHTKYLKRAICMATS